MNNEKKKKKKKKKNIKNKIGTKGLRGMSVGWASTGTAGGSLVRYLDIPARVPPVPAAQQNADNSKPNPLI